MVPGHSPCARHGLVVDVKGSGWLSSSYAPADGRPFVIALVGPRWPWVRAAGHTMRWGAGGWVAWLAGAGFSWGRIDALLEHLTRPVPAAPSLPCPGALRWGLAVLPHPCPTPHPLLPPAGGTCGRSTSPWTAALCRAASLTLRSTSSTPRATCWSMARGPTSTVSALARILEYGWVTPF